MQTQKFTQIGTFSIAVFLPLTLIFGGLTFMNEGADKTNFNIYLGLSIVMLLCLLTFYKLTIVIDKNTFTYKLGLGIVRKSYLLSTIKTCRPVKNSMWYGIGIRILPNGWLINVSGLEAVELNFKHKSSVTRIGTNIPLEVAEAVNARLPHKSAKP